MDGEQLRHKLDEAGTEFSEEFARQEERHPFKVRRETAPEGGISLRATDAPFDAYSAGRNMMIVQNCGEVNSQRG
jgi:hypothetical protein